MVAVRAVEAVAHPNIALVKYWGKADGDGNVPATPSLSITLAGFESRTRVSAAAGGTDEVTLNGQVASDAKINGFLKRLRERFAVPPLAISSDNNFPTASGLASSASGFAALASGINEACKLGLDAATCSGWARQASASAARSLFGGFATLRPPAWQAAPLLPAEDWPLEVVVAICSVERKGVSSTAGMQASKATSPYFPAWTEQTPKDFDAALKAVARQDFEALATVAERSCLQMHALMLATHPGLLYWKGATVDAMHEVRALREAGTAVFFTIDAGPQLKAVCLPSDAAAVELALGKVPGVLATHRLKLGGGAEVRTLPQ